MSKKICGVSKRHFRRLLAKERLNNGETSEKNNENTVFEMLNFKIQNTTSKNENNEHSDCFEIDSCQTKENDNLVDNLTNWSVKHKIRRMACDDLLKILAKEGLNVPQSTKTLFGTQSVKITTINVSPGIYYHFGLERGIKELKFILNDSIETLFIDIGIDGLPLFKSSSQTLWPILGAISNCRDVKPFLIGAYLGKKKPENVQQYVNEFVKEFKNLQNSGIELSGKYRQIKIKIFICDAPAKAFLTGTVGHTSGNGCSKCIQKGKKINNRLTYSTTVFPLRTDADFKNRKDIAYHNKFFQQNAHLLEEININMISQFPLDVMHLIDLGVTKKILVSIWNNDHFRTRLSSIQKQNLNLKFISMQCFIPKEFCRKPRSFDELLRWKATEFRQLILYTGIVLFKDVLHLDLYEHLLLLHGAYRLVSCPKNCQKNLDCVQEMLETFVHNFTFLYGREKVSYNVHNLLHLTECIKLYGNVDNFSAYKFENFMQTLKKDCRQPTKILEQLHNRITERNSKLKEEFVNKTGLKILTKKKVNTTSFPIYRSYYFDEFILNDSIPNNFCYITPITPIQVKGFFKNSNGDEYVIGSKFLKVGNYFEEPFESLRTLGICFATNISEVEEIFEITNIACKIVAFAVDEGFVLIPVLHSCVS